jgi:hypothetical protein
VTNGILNPADAGSGFKILRYTYTDTVTGCSATGTRSVQISSVAGLFVNNDPICSNAGSINPNFVISPTGGLYIFQGDTITSLDVSLLSPGQYNMDYLYDLTACDSTYSFSFTVTAAPSVPQITVQGDSLICSQPADSYRWFRNGNILAGLNTASIQATLSGFYQVEVEDAVGCSEISDSVEYVSSVGNDEELISQWGLFPNPNNGAFELTLPPSFQGTIRILDASGKEVYNRSLEGGMSRLPLRLTLASGVYTLTAEGQKEQQLRFIVE